jgi:hypothetical protein
MLGSRRYAIVAALSGAIILVAASGYVLGKSSGEDLDAARLSGAKHGRAEGAARGAEQGFSSGYSAGRKRGYRQGYKSAYRKARNTPIEQGGSQQTKSKETPSGGPGSAKVKQDPAYEDDNGAYDPDPPPIGSYENFKDFCNDQPEETECGGPGDPRETQP